MGKIFILIAALLVSNNLNAITFISDMDPNEYMSQEFNISYEFNNKDFIPLAVIKMDESQSKNESILALLQDVQHDVHKYNASAGLYFNFTTHDVIRNISTQCMPKLIITDKTNIKNIDKMTVKVNSDGRSCSITRAIK